MSECIKANLHTYQLRHLIRAHSLAGNINDRSTRVNDAAYEIDPSATFTGTLNEVLAYTNICATCGLNVVNLIDTETGKVVKRFNDDAFMNRVKEVFYRLAWTVLNGCSILIAAGEHGQIKVIIPKYSSCLGRIDAHSRPIRCLMFDYKYKNILFTGSDDHTIKIWRLELKLGQSDLECECSCDLLGVIQYNQTNSKNERVNSMCFVTDRYLIISTELENYSVKVNLRKILRSKEKKAEALEKVDENITNENVMSYMMSSDIDKTSLILVAEPLKIEVDKKNLQFVANSLIFISNLLYANEVGSKYIYIFDVETNEDVIKLKQIDNLAIGEEKFTSETRLSLLNEDNGTTQIFKSNPDGQLDCIKLDPFGRKATLVYRYALPCDYIIKPVSMTAARTEMKSYDLFDKPCVLLSVSNADTIVSITDQNIIAVFKKYDDSNLLINLS